MLVIGCNHKDTNVPVVGFVDASKTTPSGRRKPGFIDALEQAKKKKRYAQIIYRNAQGNIPTLTQIVNYFIAQEVSLIATNPSLSTITTYRTPRLSPYLRWSLLT
ncbi:MAG: hypothetical protein IPI77_23475 [Saprospiraceae bacterium]|nr:hypothetical protein [Saprospiraceae bacterium]